MPDIDIDFADRVQALENFKHVAASIKEKDNTPLISKKNAR